MVVRLSANRTQGRTNQKTRITWVIIYFKIDPKKIKTVQIDSPETEKGKKVNMQRLWTSNFTAISLKQDAGMRRNLLPKFMDICMERACWWPSGWAPT